MQGLLLLNKPIGITSYGVVSRIKKISGEKRVGHTGTLDPMASGVLPVFLGRATALSSYLLDADKEYTANLKLGIKTDTGDITGEIIARKAENITDKITEHEIDTTLKEFLGEIKQTPPMYSAIKVNGVRLYKMAREGKTVSVPERTVKVYSIERTSDISDDNEFGIKTKVSKGTYIRSLCSDIGDRLNTGATLTALCRTSAAGFDIRDCIDLESLNEENIFKYLKSEEYAVRHLPEISVTEKQAVRFSNGGQLSFERLRSDNLIDGDIYRVKCGDFFLGLGEANAEKSCLAVKCVINVFHEVETK